jgi:hypothetical protein
MAPKLSPSTVRCGHCQRRRVVRFDTDGIGGVSEHVEPCLSCAGGRKDAGVCRDCQRPVAGTIGKAQRCVEHKRAARLRQGREHLNRGDNRTRKNAAWRERYHAEDDAKREKRRRRKREWERRNPDKKKVQRRRYALRHPEVVLAGYERNNARIDVILKRRELAHRQTIYCEREPTCADCGAVVPWNRRGRPHKRCSTCDPRAWKRDQATPSSGQSLEAA